MITGDILAIEHDGSVIMFDGLDPKKDYPKLESIEQTKEIHISGEGRTTRVGTLLDEDQKREMEQFLRNNFDIFAWLATKMLGISLTVIYHSLNVIPTVWPIKQKKIKFAPDKVKAVKQETKKLLKADFIRKVYHPN